MRGLVVCLVSCFLLLPVWANEPEGSVTVGEFIQQLASTTGLTATDAQTATLALAEVGVRLPEDLVYDDQLTEGDVIKLSRAMGLRVTTSRPDRYFDQKQVDLFFASFGDELSSADDNTSTSTRDDCAIPSGDCTNPGVGDPPFSKYRPPFFDVFGKGKGKSKGKSKPPTRTPIEPE
jgi:hypothetical protein